MQTKDGDGKILLVRTKVADEFCMFGEMLQITWLGKGNERAEMRSTTMKNHENLGRERTRK